jgi:hypothetical protein
MSTEDILVEVFRERVRQEQAFLDGKHPYRLAAPDTDDCFRCAVLMEEVGEVAHEVNELEAHFTLERIEKLKKELIQVAAVAVAWLRGLEKDAVPTPPMPLNYTNRDMGSVASAFA